MLTICLVSEDCIYAGFCTEMLTDNPHTVFPRAHTNENQPIFKNQ